MRGWQRWRLVLLLAMALPGWVGAFHIHLHGVVTELFSGEGIKGVQVRLVKDSIERSTVVTAWNGKYELFLDRGYEYQVWFHHPVMVTKHVVIDAREVPLMPDVPFYDMDLQMTLFEWVDGFSFEAFDKPVALAEYKHSVRNLNWANDYTQERRDELARVMVHYERHLVAMKKAGNAQPPGGTERGGRGERRRKPVDF